MRIGASDDCGIDRWDSFSKDERLLCPTDQKVERLSSLIKCWKRDRDNDRGGVTARVSVYISWGSKGGPRYGARGELEIHDGKGNEGEIAISRDSDGHGRVEASGEHNSGSSTRN